VDLCYGLPGQTEATFDATLAEIARLSPDRVAVFGYAHMPWLRPMQRRIDEKILPSTETRIRLLALGRTRLLHAGYRAIGMDHFAHPDDELARALDDGTLHRNFQGYTTTRTDTMIGFGISSIGDFGGALVQNLKSLADWSKAIEEGRLPTERGAERSAEDVLRGHVIMEIMCTFGLDVAAVERRFSVDFATHFAVELDDLRRLSDQGLLSMEPDRLRLTPLGTVFVRNVAMVFDEYTRARAAQRAAGRRFSRTV
jgi:oxygen-independent coproporphyrinogen-3 oxidase